MPISSQEPRKQPGLASIHKAREDRARGKFSRPTASTFGYVGLAVLVSVMVYRFFAGREIEDTRSKLLAKQRAAEQELGGRWFPIRDRIEVATLEAAKAFQGDHVEPDAMHWDFRNQPGIYLRMRAAEAGDIASLRRAAADSVKDGFTGCLLRTPNAAAARGDQDAGAFAEQPWNLRQAYVATRVLTPEWVADVKAADDDLRLRVFGQQYEKAVATEIPLAADIVTRAKFFLLVLDDDVDAARDNEGDAGGRITEESLQLVAHPSRVHLVNLKSGREVARLKRTGEASFVLAGEQHAVDEETRHAMQRQVNNCSLARQVEDALTPAPALPAKGTTEPRDAGRD